MNTKRRFLKGKYSYEEAAVLLTQYGRFNFILREGRAPTKQEVSIMRLLVHTNILPGPRKRTNKALLAAEKVVGLEWLDLILEREKEDETNG